MGAVWVGKVAGNEDFVWLHLFEQVAHNLNILFGHRQLLNLTALVEWQVEEVNMVERNLVVGAGCACLTTTDESLDGAHVGSIDVAFFLFGKEFLDVLIHLLDGFIFLVVEDLVETIYEVHETCYLFVVNGDVARCFVGNMQVVTLVNKSLDCSTHRDNVVVGVRREHNNTLWEWLCTLRTICVVGIRLSAWPSCNGVLQVVENLYVCIIC